MKLLIGADLVPTETNIALFQKGDAVAMVGEELLDILNGADYRIFNLEIPLTDKSSPIGKCGPALIAPTATVAGYQALGVDLLAVANNHILDQDIQGLHSTLKTLDTNGIAYVGGGDCLKQAAQPCIVDRDGKKIGIYACAEHEFSIAGDETPGANPFDPLESPDHVAALKAQCDYVIVLYHGGKEHYRYPSPNLQKICRKLVEKGADLIICQHSHCVGCEEKYQNGTIVYGQGNFLFDHSASEFWKTSLLVQINDDFSISYIPLVKHGNGVRLAQDQDAITIMDAFFERSREIAESGMVQRKYAQFAGEMQTQYLLKVSTINSGTIFFRAINRLTGFRWGRWLVNCKYPKRKLLAVRNCIECEAHRELFLQGLKKERR